MTESLEDIAEEIANWAGVYGGCHCDGEGRQPVTCCRPGFVTGLVSRIRTAAVADWKLGALGEKP